MKKIIAKKSTKTYLFASNVIAVLVHKHNIGVRSTAMESGSANATEIARLYVGERKSRMYKKGTHPTAWLKFSPTAGLFNGCDMNLVYNGKTYPIDTNDLSIMRIASTIATLLTSLINAK